MSASLSDMLRVDLLAHSERLLLLIPFALFCLLLAWRRRRSALVWPALTEARAAGARSSDGFRWLRYALRGAALLMLAWVIAEPKATYRSPAELGPGLDLMLVLDASGSMRAMDARMDDSLHTRFELARQVVARFADARVSQGDRVGLVVFGESAFTQCPLTRDGKLLESALTRTAPGIAGETTALGDALLLAVKRVTRGEPITKSEQAQAGRVVVLLTDGRSNAGAAPMDVATEVAKTAGVRVHTVGIGSRGEVPMQQAEGSPGRGLHFERHDLDVATLEATARETGGRFFAARGSQDLAAVYTAIDALERVPRRAPPSIRQVDRSEPWLALAGVFLLLEIGSVRVARRELP